MRCRGAIESLEDRAMLAVLYPGDANQDLYFDEADLIQVLKAGKFLTGQSATWSEGDWDGSPGGTPGQPPVGNGLFDSGDIVLNAFYRTGKYDPSAGDPMDSLQALTVDDASIATLYYDRLLKTLTLDTQGKPLSALHLTSSRGVLEGALPMVRDPFWSVFGFDFATANDFFTINTMAGGIRELTIPIDDRYSEQELLGDLRIDGSWKGAMDAGVVEYDPETGSLTISNNTDVTALEILSSSDRLASFQVDPQLFDGQFDVRRPGKLFKLLPSGFADRNHPLVLPGVLPVGWTMAQLQGDLRITGAVKPNGSLNYEWRLKGDPAGVTQAGPLGPVRLVCNCGVGDGLIQGQVFEDANRNGQRDPGEAAFSGWQVQLSSVERDVVVETTQSSFDRNQNGTVDADEEGMFVFKRLPAGHYAVTVVPPREYEFLAFDQNTAYFTLGVNQQINDAPFAATLVKTGFVRGQVWRDLDRNGRRDRGEHGLNGIVVSVGGQRHSTTSRDWNGDGVIDPEAEQGWFELELLPDRYSASAHLPEGWFASTPTLTSLTVTSEQATEIHFGMREVPLGDVNGDYLLNAADIDTLFRAIRFPQLRRSVHDLFPDFRVDYNDVRKLVKDYLRSTIGDANLDGRFDSQDLVLVLQAGEYNDLIDGNSTWVEGDWTGDGNFNAFDLVLALQEGDYVSGTPAISRSRMALSAIPAAFPSSTPSDTEPVGSIDRAGVVFMSMSEFQAEWVLLIALDEFRTRRNRLSFF